MKPFRAKTALFLAAAALLVAALTLVSRSTQPPPLPLDPTHRTLGGNGECAPCHAAGGANPLSREHPPKNDCLRCHPRAD